MVVFLSCADISKPLSQCCSCVLPPGAVSKYVCAWSFTLAPPAEIAKVRRYKNFFSVKWNHVFLGKLPNTSTACAYHLCVFDIWLFFSCFLLSVQILHCPLISVEVLVFSFLFFPHYPYPLESFLFRLLILFFVSFTLFLVYFLFISLWCFYFLTLFRFILSSPISYFPTPWCVYLVSCFLFLSSSYGLWLLDLFIYLF